MTDTAIADISHIPVSQGLSKTLARASEGARASGAPEVSLEHILAALCDDTDAADVLAACAVDLGRLKSDVITYIVQQSGGIAGPTVGPVTVSPGLVRILEAAAAAARGGRRRDINGAIVLAAIVGEGRSVAAQILQGHGLTFDGAIRALQAAQMQPARAPAPEMPPPAEDVLARARERVQSRAAPSLRDMMARPQLAERPAPAPGFPDIVPAHRGGHTSWPAPSKAQPVDAAPAQPAVQTPEPAAPAPAVPEPPNESAPAPESMASGVQAEPAVAAPAPEPAAAVPVPAPTPPESVMAEERPQPPADPGPASAPPETSHSVSQPAAPAAAPPPPSSAPRWTPAGDLLPAPPSAGPPQAQPAPSPERAESAAAPAGSGGYAPSVEMARPPAEAPAAAPPPPPPMTAPAYRAPSHSAPPMPPASPPDFAHGPGSFGAPPMQPYPGFPPGQPMQAQQQRPPYPPPPPGMPPASAGAGGDLGHMPFGNESARQGPRPPPIPPALPTARPQANPYGAPPSVSAAPNAAPSPSYSPAPAPMSRSAASPGPRREAAAQAELGQLAENIPRVMRAGVTERVEIRLARAHVANLTGSMEGSGAAWRHDMMVTKAMSVRIRAPEGGFFIETVSPETQWIDNQFLDAGEDYASWRFLITPQSRGWSELQIVVSARTVGSEGLAAETAFPDQTIDIKVRTNYGRALLKGLGWAAAAIAGGAIAKFGEGAVEVGSSLAAKLLG